MLSSRHGHKKMQREDINPTLWGPGGWNFLDFVATGYPDVAMAEEQLAMTNFLKALGVANPKMSLRHSS